MDEIRKNHIVQMQTKDGIIVDGIVFDYIQDRIMILVSFDSLNDAKNIKELDLLQITAYTHLGVKRMFSHVIDPLKSNNCIVVENNPSVPIEQKRQFVRVLSNVTFKIEKEDESELECYCINISAGGIAFSINSGDFEIGEHVVIMLSEGEFEKEINAKAQIIKHNNHNYVAKFLNLSPQDEGKIVKHVFKLIAKK